MKLDLYGTSPWEGWTILAPEAGPEGEYVAVLPALSQFADHSIEQIHAWHILNKLNGAQQIALLKECHRILQPGGVFAGTVPDMDALCRLFLSIPDTGTRMAIAGMIYGDHSTPRQINHFGFNTDLVSLAFSLSGFQRISFTTQPYRQGQPPNLIEGIAIDLHFVAEA